MRIRKQCYELTEADLAAHPLWEFAIDEEGFPGQDEATVKPIPFASVPTEGYGSMVVAATAQIADGRAFPATLYLNSWRGTGVAHDHDDLGQSQPCLIIAGGLWAVWFGELPSTYITEGMKRFYAQTGLTPVQLFPITVTANLLVEGETEPRGTTVPGFQYRDEQKRLVTLT